MELAEELGGAINAVEDDVTGYLIDPEKSRDLADKIVYLSNHPYVYSKMGCRARERAIQSFAWKHRAVQLAERLNVGPVTLRSQTDLPAEHHAFDR